MSSARSAGRARPACKTSARFLPPSTFGYFLVSIERASLYPIAGSQGKLCLGGAPGRFNGPGQVVGSGAAGAYTVPIDLDALPTPGGPVSRQVGETYHFQSWFRDANPNATSNLTDAVTVTLR